MKLIDIRSKTDDDLKVEYSNLKEELFRIRFQHATSQLENHRKIPLLKKDIAKILTVMRERELSLNKQ